MTATDQLAQLEWARDCYERGLGDAVEQQIAYLRGVIREENASRITLAEIDARPDYGTTMLLPRSKQGCAE